MPNLAQLMTSGRNYPGALPTTPPLAAPDAPGASLATPAVQSNAFGQTLASFLAQAGVTDPAQAQGIAKGSSPGQFTLTWGTETLHLLSTDSSAEPSPETLVIVPPEAYAQFAKTRGAKARTDIINSIVGGTQNGATLLGGQA